ncbi:unnamed protein product [Rotaria sp. Silwood2]|nr:unnamed protein product [Rotaria sp. Silwood2]CAF4022498.1 unnamed protein product [Rotaria sp. Silwood2]CAF4301596.1 unnamed protein product [Rotaria sp. Silwood2]
MEIFDLFNLPDDVLLKSNESFYGFVEQVTGKVEADILRVQGISNARSLIRSKNLLDIFKLDCDEVNALKPLACFQCKTGDFIVKQGIQLNLDNLFDALKEKHEKYTKKNKKHQHQHESSSIDLIPSTPLTNINNNDSLTIRTSSVGITIPDSSNIYSFTTSQSSYVSKYKTINDHAIFINDLIEKFSRKTFISVILKQNEHYDLMIAEDGQVFKATIKCQCGSKITLPIRSLTSSVILSNFYSHLTTSNCSMVDRIFKEQEKAATKQVEASSSLTSVPKSPISPSNDNNSGSGKQSKRKRLYDILSTTMSSSKKEKKQKKID